MSNKSNRKSRIPDALAVLTVLTAGLAACGSAVSPTAPSASVPESSGPTVILSQTLPGVQAGDERFINFSVPRKGRLELTVDWSDPSNSVFAVLTAAGCFSFPDSAADCEVRRSFGREGKEGREEVIDFPGAQGAYLLRVQNLGPGADSIRVTGVLTPASDAPEPAPPTPRPTERPDRGHPCRGDAHQRGSGSTSASWQPVIPCEVAHN